MRSSIERYTVDRAILTRSFPVATSRARRERFKKFYNEWMTSLQSLDFDSMSQDGKVDYILFRNHLEYELRQLDIQSRQINEIEPLLPFATKIIELEETRRRMEPINSPKVAATLTELRKQVDEKRRALELGLRPEGRGGDTNPGVKWWSGWRWSRRWRTRFPTTVRKRATGGRQRHRGRSDWSRSITERVALGDDSVHA
jgi:hypothetical protein